MTLTLTEDEIELILKMRSEKAARHRQDLLIAHLLRTASEFEIWRQEEGASRSYTTFIDDFGYQGKEVDDALLAFSGHDKAISRKIIHEGVIALISHAQQFTRQ